MPERFPRRILLTAVGLSPQVVTETLYALAVARTPPFVPTEVHVFTTAEGANRVRLQLLSDDPGWFHRLLQEYALPPIRCAMETVHVVQCDGRPLDDVHTPEDNIVLADAATALVADLCQDADTAVHVSIAGGRKTMGYYLGYALSLYGRAQDRLSHVLVDPPFESHPEFFYPTRHKRVIYSHTPDRRPLDTSEARVMLAEIPFVRLREGLPDMLRDGRMSFSATVALAQESLGPASLLLDMDEGVLFCNARRVVLPRICFAFYATVTRLWLDEHAPGRDALPVDRLLAAYRRLAGAMDGNYERVASSLRGATELPVERFDEYCSRTNRALRQAMGPLADTFILHGKRDPGTRVNRYGPWHLARARVRFGKLGEKVHHAHYYQSYGE